MHWPSYTIECMHGCKFHRDCKSAVNLSAFSQLSSMDVCVSKECLAVQWTQKWEQLGT